MYVATHVYDFNIRGLHRGQGHPPWAADFHYIFSKIHLLTTVIWSAWSGLLIFPHKAGFSRGRRPRPCWISVKTIYWSGDFQERFFLFDPSLTSGMSAALMQGHCLRRRPCIKQHMSGDENFTGSITDSSHHISPDTRQYMRQGWLLLSQCRRQWANIKLAFGWKIKNIQYLNHPPYPNRWMITLIQQGSVCDLESREPGCQEDGPTILVS